MIPTQRGSKIERLVKIRIRRSDRSCSITFDCKGLPDQSQKLYTSSFLNLLLDRRRSQFQPQRDRRNNRPL